MLGCDCCCINSFVYLVGFLAIASKIIPVLVKLFKGEKPIELQEKNYKKDVVYFYQRRNTIRVRGRNGQMPFIELNGEHHSDSQIIIRRLTQTHSDDHSAAIGHAVDRMLDNHTFNLKLMAKNGKGVDKMIGVMAGDIVPPVLLPLVSTLGGWFLSKKMAQRAAVSIGKFEEKECKELLRNDLVQLQTILGKKKFLLGDEPATVDCTALGQLSANAIPSSRYYFNDLLDSSEFAPLRDYAERVKTRIFGNEFCDTERFFVCS